MMIAGPVETDIVLIGGGHANVEVIRKFGMKPQPGVRLTLISTPVDTPYSGMLPGHLAGHYSFDDYTVDLRRLCRFANTRLIIDRATGLDRDEQMVQLSSRPPISYDLLCLDVGSTPDTTGITGTEFAIPVKPVPQFMERWGAVEEIAVEKKGDIRIVVVGAGAGGVEATLSLHFRLTNKLSSIADARDPHFTIISRSKQAMPGHAAGVRNRLLKALDRKNIAVVTGETVTKIDDQQVATASGRQISCDAAILVTPGGAPKWLAKTGLTTDDRGFVRVGETLQSVNDPAIFAAGDCASFDPSPLPKAGVYAVRQGPVLADNLRAAARQTTLKPFKPQRNILALVSLGEKSAVASKSFFSASGEWVWRWKDRIDRKWMTRYEDLPDMAPQQTPAGDVADEMRCGGCGAKVPQAILQSVLQTLRDDPATARGLSLDEPDDAAPVAIPAGATLYQTVDQFRAFIDDPFLFAQIATNHCLGDIFAMGGAPQSALITVTLPYAAPEIVARDLEQLLRGVLQSLDKAGATLIGGHTAEGAEMTIGLTVNGLVQDRPPWRKAGAKPGDRLILTKPLGTGVLLAAEMKRAAHGRDVQAALASMLVSNQAAVPLLAEHGATACTDVTGFGLGGHLLEMLGHNGSAAALIPDAFPCLDSAADLLRAGHASTLHPANAASIALQYQGDAPTILADPQTAGGLLATVPADAADACLGDLRQAGYTQAADIGFIEEAANGGPRLRAHGSA